MAKPFVIEGFGGLDLFSDPREVGPARSTSISNLDVLPGRIQTRPGYANLSDDAFTLAPRNLAYFRNTGDPHWLVAQTDSGETTPINLDDGSSGTASIDNAFTPNSYTMFSLNPATPRLYMGNFGGGVTHWNGAAWTTPAGIPTGELLSVQPKENRLVIASGTLSQVNFSNVDDPDTFDASNFVQLDMNDGEAGLTACAAWRDYLFFFKQTKFYVFYGNSLDADGGVIFNYRTVNTGVGASYGSAVAGEEGVFFANQEGVYLTTGDAPRYLSRAIEPWIRDGSFASLGSLTLDFAVLTYHHGRLYVTDVFNNKTLVYDPTLDAWMVWLVGASGSVAVPWGSHEGLYFGVTGSKKVVTSSGQTDAGTNIAWSYVSGQYPVGDPGRIAVIAETSVMGYANNSTVTVDLYSDTIALDTASSTVTVGSIYDIEGFTTGADQEGYEFKHGLFGSQWASISRLAHYVASVKPAGVQ